MPFIQFPNVPDVPGVPQLLRLPVARTAIQSSVATVTALAGPLGGILAQAIEQDTKWGIYDATGNIFSPTVGAKQLALQYIGSNAAYLSTLNFDYQKEMRVSDFPVEPGSFASYNKVEMPASPVVTLSLSGNADDRADFLNRLDTACKSTNLYTVVTPEATYPNCTIERYNYQKRGSVLLIAEILLKEVRQVSAAYSKVAQSPIVSPQQASATPSVDAGKVQTTVPETSTLKALFDKFGIK